MINNPIIYKFLKDFTSHRKKTNRAIVFGCRLFPNIVNYNCSFSLALEGKTGNKIPKSSGLEFLDMRYRIGIEQIYLC